MHKDRNYAPVLSSQGRKNHEAIFGPATGAGERTEREQARFEESRRYHHAKLAEDGKKPADWYLDNERRVAQDPSRLRRSYVSEAYRKGHRRIFGN